MAAELQFTDDELAQLHLLGSQNTESGRVELHRTSRISYPGITPGTQASTSFFEGSLMVTGIKLVLTLAALGILVLTWGCTQAVPPPGTVIVHTETPNKESGAAGAVAPQTRQAPAQLAALQEQIAAGQAELGRLMAAREAANLELTARQEQATAQRKDMEALEVRLSERTAAYTQLEQRRKAFQSELESVAAQVARDQAGQEKLATQIASQRQELTQVLASLDVEKQAFQGLADRKSILSGDLQQLENQIQTRRDELQDLAKPVPATVPALKTAPVPVLPPPGVTDPSPLASAPAQPVGAATQETGAVSSSATKPTAAHAVPAVPSTFGLGIALFLGSRWWFWTILGILVFLAVGFVVKRWSNQS